MDFGFRNIVLQKAIGAVFGEAVRLMVAAFLRRARVVYGPPVVGAKAVAGERGRGLRDFLTS